MKKTAVTMKDIGKCLNISSVTVSKALNDKDGVSEELREKIKQTAVEMGYRLNTSARAMKEGRMYNIGILVPARFVAYPNSFYLEFYKKIVGELENHSYYAIMQIISDEDEEKLVMPRLNAESKVDGIFILGQMSDEYVQMIHESDIPLILIDFYGEHPDIDAVVTDNFYGAYEITNYLIRHGHREIGYVGSIGATSSIQDRFLGYYKSLIEHRIKLDEEFILPDRDIHGRQIDVQIPKRIPTAFVCNCDEIAYRFITRLNEEGIRVPEDCSIVGFDNTFYSQITMPRLTTLETSSEEISRFAVHNMMRKLAGDTSVQGRVMIKGRLIERDSVKTLESQDS